MSSCVILHQSQPTTCKYVMVNLSISFWFFNKFSIQKINYVGHSHHGWEQECLVEIWEAVTYQRGSCNYPYKVETPLDSSAWKRISAFFPHFISPFFVIYFVILYSDYQPIPHFLDLKCEIPPFLNLSAPRPDIEQWPIFELGALVPNSMNVQHDLTLKHSN